MAYTKTNQQTGDVITAEKLNHLEDGVTGGTLVIGGFSRDNGDYVGTADKTWQEIDNALTAGARCIIVCAVQDGHSQLIITRAALEDEKYQISDIEENFVAKTTSANGYPAIGNSPIG